MKNDSLVGVRIELDRGGTWLLGGKLEDFLQGGIKLLATHYSNATNGKHLRIVKRNRGRQVNLLSLDRVTQHGHAIGQCLFQGGTLSRIEARVIVQGRQGFRLHLPQHDLKRRDVRLGELRAHVHGNRRVLGKKTRKERFHVSYFRRLLGQFRSLDRHNRDIEMDVLGRSVNGNPDRHGIDLVDHAEHFIHLVLGDLPASLVLLIGFPRQGLQAKLDPCLQLGLYQVQVQLRYGLEISLDRKVVLLLKATKQLDWICRQVSQLFLCLGNIGVVV